MPNASRAPRVPRAAACRAYVRRRVARTGPIVRGFCLLVEPDVRTVAQDADWRVFLGLPISEHGMMNRVNGGEIDQWARGAF